MVIYMKILYVTSEAAPFASSGGLADVMGALPKEIAASGAEVELIMPYYGAVKNKYGASLSKVCDLSFSLSWRKTGATVYSCKLNGITYYFVENHYYFERASLYGEYDDAERFAFFSTAVIEFMLSRKEAPDVLHANDWQTALTVIYLKTKFASIPELSDIKTLYTIHNIEYQGKFDLAILGDVFALDEQHRAVVEYDNCINLMKGAITCSDYVNTVSPNYANELQYDYFSFGLSEIVKGAHNKMCGIINGIDYSYFSPEYGGDIDVPYSKSDCFVGKAKNKALLQKALGFDIDPNVPLIAMVTRLASQKGIDLLVRILDELLGERVQLVILGTGEAKYEAELSAKEAYHGNMRALIMFDRVVSKKIYASADIFLMPSKSEPCGLSQMIACAYGTVPVVRAVGGLYDSITPYGLAGANGFNFNNYNAHELLFAVKAALSVYGDKLEWNKLVVQAMNTDFSWSKSAADYMALYNKLISDRK